MARGPSGERVARWCRSVKRKAIASAVAGGQKHEAGGRGDYNVCIEIGDGRYVNIYPRLMRASNGEACGVIQVEAVELTKSGQRSVHRFGVPWMDWVAKRVSQALDKGERIPLEEIESAAWED